MAAYLLYSRPEDRLACRPFRTAVSLHSHTLLSREGLDFIPGLAGKIPLLDAAIRWQQAHHRFKLDLSRAWWTPPLSTAGALRVESSQIERLLSMQPLVSLTDHDCFDAARLDGTADGLARHPISVEWTVPFEESHFHLGVHNLPPRGAAAMMAAMQWCTQSCCARAAGEVLAWLAGHPEILIVFNHPCWDERGVGAARHAVLVREFLRRYRDFLHAVELNGLRRWKENMAALALAGSAGLPVISGGDRHGHEPNALVNLTHASCFSGFAAEIRQERWSRPVFLPHYHEAHAWRVFQTLCDVLLEYQEHDLGWTRWSDRVFYRCDDGAVRSLSVLWGGQPPLLVRHFVGLAHLAGERKMRDALRFTLARNGEVAA
jgi:hypothetical protein